MASTHIYKSRRECVKGSRSKSAPKNENLASPKNFPPRQIRPSIAATARSTPFKAVQDLLTPPRALVTRSVTRAQKTKRITEAKDPQERPRRDSPPVFIPATASGEQIDPSQNRGDQQSEYHPDGHSKKQRRQYVPGLKLSKRNLEKFQSQLDSTSIGMGVISTTRGGKQGEKGGAKRTRALSTWSDLPQDSTTVTTSSISPARYRYDILKNAKIFVHHVAPPKGIQSQVNAIFHRGISRERRSEISSIAKGMSHEFTAIIQANRREDDCVEVVITALKALDKEKMFDFVRKADWDRNLKPNPPQLFDFKHLSQNKEADHTAERPTKRQRRNSCSDPSSEKSQSDTLASKHGQHSGVKTPRPDCTVGLSHSTIAHALSERGLKRSQADEFLEGLQREHILYSDPTENFMKVRFPILVVEGKAYATGKTAFEAENQAAVAASCMVNLLQQLTDVHDRCVPDPPRGKKAPLAFSISTWGPLLQFWVHYPLVEDNITSYHMSVLKTCHACVADELEDFLLMLEQLMSWNKDDFLTKIAGQLFAVAKRTPYRK